MRLLLKLNSLRTVEQSKENNSKYFTGMHGWIYNLLDGPNFKDLHKSSSFKPFCFSNIYPVQNHVIMEKGIYAIIISSISEFLIIEIISKLQKRIEENGKKLIEGVRINLGEYSFELLDFLPLPTISLKEGDILENENLINLTIRDKKGNIKAITLDESPAFFKSCLQKNLIRKYNFFSKEKVDELFDLFKNINIIQLPKSKKSVKINLIKQESDNWFNVIGARYRFKLGKLNETQKKILQLCYDLGFGERNTFGFGFMNLKNSEKKDL